MKKTEDSFKGAFSLFGAALIYASFGLLIREMAKMFGDNSQVAFRFMVAFTALSVFFYIKKKVVKLPRAAIKNALALGVAFCVILLLFTISINNTKIANTVFLLYSGSIISSLLIGTLFLKEKLTPIKIVAIVLSLAGLAMYSSAILSLSIGVITAVLAGLVEGGANALRKQLKGYDRNTVLWYQFLIGSLVALGVVLLSGETIIKEVTLLPIIVGIIFGLLQIGLGNLLLYGFQHFDVNVGTVILACELIFAAILGWLFLSETPTGNEVLGGALIFIASIISTVDFKSLSKRLITA